MDLKVENQTSDPSKRVTNHENSSFPSSQLLQRKHSGSESWWLSWKHTDHDPTIVKQGHYPLSDKARYNWRTYKSHLWRCTSSSLRKWFHRRRDLSHRKLKSKIYAIWLEKDRVYAWSRDYCQTDGKLEREVEVFWQNYQQWFHGTCCRLFG